MLLYANYYTYNELIIIHVLITKEFLINLIVPYYKLKAQESN